MNKHRVKDFFYSLCMTIKDNVLFFIDDFKDYQKEKRLLKTDGKVKKKKKYKINASKEIMILFLIALLGALIISIKTNVNNLTNINANKIYEIDYINFIGEDSSRVMIIDDKDGIKDIVKTLNSYNKISKSEYDKQNKKDSIFETTEDDSDELVNVLVFKYKKKTEFIKFYKHHIEYKNKTYYSNKDIDKLWYVYNFKTETISNDEIKEYIK
ncbi:MAG: hypothetical protein MJ245_05085 [Clostridia bacterium]|nr:hypothetical protein [Clostridia bacterium]